MNVGAFVLTYERHREGEIEEVGCKIQWFDFVCDRLRYLLSFKWKCLVPGWKYNSRIQKSDQVRRRWEVIGMYHNIPKYNMVCFLPKNDCSEEELLYLNGSQDGA